MGAADDCLSVGASAAVGGGESGVRAEGSGAYVEDGGLSVGDSNAGMACGSTCVTDGGSWVQAGSVVGITGDELGGRRLRASTGPLDSCTVGASVVRVARSSSTSSSSTPYPQL